MAGENPIGRRSQAGGAIAAFLGLLLWATAGPVTAGPVDRHKLALAFFVIGSEAYFDAMAEIAAAREPNVKTRSLERGDERITDALPDDEE